MKLQLIVAVLLGTVCANAFADGGGEGASSQLQNLVYYPHAGHARIAGQFIGSLQDSGSTSNNLGVQTVSRSTTYERANASLAYGIIGGLRVSLAETYLFDQKVQATTLPGNVTSQSDARGFSDPTVGLAERLYDSRGEGFYADAAASFVPHLGRAMAAGNGQSGNNLSSAWSASASLPLYYCFRWSEFITDAEFVNEFQLAPSITRSFGGVTSGALLKSSTLTSSYWSGSVALSDRFHLNSSWYVQPGVTVNFPFSYRNSSQTPGAADTYQKVDLTATPSVTIGYLPVDRVMIVANMAYVNQGTSSYPATGSGTSAQTAQTSGGLQVQLAF